MIIAEKKSTNHYISPSSLTFTENYQGDPDIVYVSIARGAIIKAYRSDEAGLGYGSDSDYQYWRLNGATVGLNSRGADKQFEIYARLSRTGRNADVIFSLNNYNIQGGIITIDENGEEQVSDPSDSYWYIKIGFLTAPSGGLRTLYYDSGELGTRKADAESNDMFELIVVPGSSNDNAGGEGSEGGDGDEGGEGSEGGGTGEEGKTPIIRPKHKFEKLLVLGESVFEGPAKFESISFPIEKNTKGNIAFTAGNFNSAAGQITGAQLTKQGVFTAAGIIAQSFEVMELIYNKIKAQGGKFVYSNAAVVEKCFYNIELEGSIVRVTPDEYYAEESPYKDAKIVSVLFVFKDDAQRKDTIPFQSGDILYGYVNNIGGSGQYAKGGESIMYVIDDDADIELTRPKEDVEEETPEAPEEEPVAPINEGEVQESPEQGEGEEYETYIVKGVEAKLFSEVKPDFIEDDSIDEAHLYYYSVVGNMPPTDGMALAQRGNVGAVEGRTTSFFIDTETSNIIMLQNVTTPVLKTEYYGVINGKLPSDLLAKIPKDLPIGAHDPVVYAKHGIFENFIQLDHVGQPIQKERNRGAWDKETAENEEKDEKGDYKNRYKNNSSIFDTVTHRGNVYKCISNNTTNEPTDDISRGWLLLVKGGKDAQPVYWLNPDVNKIHVNKEGKLDASAISISVFKSDSNGLTEITSQDGLSAEGLRIEYSIDCTDQRYEMYLNDDAEIELEDGSGVVVSERGDDVVIGIESAEIAVKDINYYVMLWLVQDDKDIDSKKIEKSSDGFDGAAGQGVSIDSVLYSVSESGDIEPTSWYSGKPSLVQGWYLWTKVKYTDGKEVLSTTYIGKDGNSGKSIYINSTLSSITVPTAEAINMGGFHEYQSVNNVNAVSELTCYYNGEIATVDDITVPTFDFISLRYLGNSGVELTISIPSGTPVSLIPTSIPITMTVRDGDAVVASTYSIAVIQSQRGLTGKQGDVGPIYMMCGDWSKEQAQARAYDIPEGSSALPLVCYKTSDSKDEYYIHEGNNDTVRQGTPPPTEGSGWRYVTSMPYIVADLLMANFAKLGSKYGAVFYANYMFSQFGIPKDETYSTSYSTYANKMFEGAGDVKTLTDVFNPNLFLDFYSGGAKFGKLSESFIRVEGETPLHVISLSSSHNVSTSYRGLYPRVITLPSAKEGWSEDGTHCTIAYDYWHGYSIPMSDEVRESYYNNMVIICADNRMMTSETNDKDYFDKLRTLEDDSNGWIVWRGTRCKFLILEPSSMVSFRSLRTEDKGVVWFVDNASEFEIANSKFYIYNDYNDGNGSSIEVYQSSENPYYNPLGVIVGPASLNRKDGQTIEWCISAKVQDDAALGDNTHYFHAKQIGLIEN